MNVEKSVLFIFDYYFARNTRICSLTSNYVFLAIKALVACCVLAHKFCVTSLNLLKYSTAFLNICNAFVYFGIFFPCRLYFSFKNVHWGRCVKNIPRSGWGIIPSILPLLFVTPAISSKVPVGFAGKF